jgi:hypothetical protein
MNRLILAVVFAVINLVALTAAAPSAFAATTCVGPGPGCFSTLQAAIDAAHDGDTIQIAAGTFAGGVTITKSVRLAGSGASSTIIRGGESVLTIGAYGAASEPSVSIDGVTITGGIARSSPESTPFVGEEGVFALGGGVEIPPNADFSGGAKVTISNSVISGNRVAPTHTVPSGGAQCPSGPCPFALAAGGGIDNWGTLTLANTTVSDNLVGSASGLSSVASDAEGGGIMNWLGALTISNSVISGNQVSATAPNGRGADSGGISLANGGRLTMNNSSVTNNSATLAASLPASVDLGAHAGGIHIGGGASGTVRNSTISGNSVSMTNTVGDANAFSGGIHTDVDFELSNDVITNNSVSVATLPGSSGNALGDSGGGEMGGTISNTRFNGNTVTVSAAAGTATASAGAAIFAGSMTDSVVNSNHVSASSPSGAVFVVGGGLMAGDGGMTLRTTTVNGNTGDATGLSGSARGGGIFDAEVPNGPPGGPLNLWRSSVTSNVLSGSSGIALQGGGVFATNPVKLVNSVIAQNTPDQCFGC